MGSYLRSITLRRGALIFAGVLLGVSIAWGGITGSISGVITDPSGGVIPGVTVMATSIATNVQHTTVTDSQGFYSFPALNVDVYRVFISHSGYRNFQEDNVKVDTNSAIRLDVKLELGTITNILTINANAVQVETESTQMGDVIEDSTIISMPLN